MVYQEFKGSLESLKEELKENIVVIYFYTPTCGKCKMQKNIFNAFQDEEFKVIGIDATENKELSRKFKVFSAPSCFTYKKGTIVSNGGFLSKKTLENLLN